LSGIKYNDPNYLQSEDKIITNKITDIKKYIIGIHLNKNVKNNFKDLLCQEKDFLENNSILIFDTNRNIIYPKS